MQFENKQTFSGKSTSTSSVLGQHDVGMRKSQTDLLNKTSNEYESLISSKLDLSNRSLTYWERKIDALEQLFYDKDIMNANQLRRGIESMPIESYLNAAYYERWLYSMTIHSIERGLITYQDLYNAINDNDNYNVNNSGVKFSKGDKVRVRYDMETLGLKWGRQHRRTPSYVHNKFGIIERYCGNFINPELDAFGISEKNNNGVPLYRVRFNCSQFENDSDDAKFGPQDTVDIEILEHWLEPVIESKVKYNHNHDDGAHNHRHSKRAEIERNALNKEPKVSGYQVLLEAFVKVLNDKNIVTNNEIRQQIEKIELRPFCLFLYFVVLFFFGLFFVNFDIFITVCFVCV